MKSLAVAYHTLCHLRVSKPGRASEVRGLPLWMV